MRKCFKQGFTLVELSIVLVIIGLIVGGVLAGQDLIEAARLRSQIKQIDDYRLAAMVFKEKYGYLPGDLTEPTATQAGFAARGTTAGKGDGNGLIEGVNAGGVGGPARFKAGETVLFWRDLSQVGLISDLFTTGTSGPADSDTTTESTTPSISDYLPRGKLTGTYLYITGTPTPNSSYTLPMPNSLKLGKNYFFLSKILQNNAGGLVVTMGSSDRGLTVMQAYSIDAKLDDAKPMTGKVMALYTAAGVEVWPSSAAETGTATTATATTCFDNGNNASNPIVYSTGFDNGSSRACALSFDAF